MATLEAVSPPSDSSDEEFLYRPLSTGAITALVFGVLSSLTFVAGRDSLQACLMMCPIPVLGIFIGLRALAKIRSNPDQYSGGKLALVGVMTSAIGLVGGLSYSGFVYATEVPTGYARTSFTEFRPDEVELRGKIAVPRDIQALDGKQVFIKGYMRGDSTPVRHNVRNFLLVRDNNQCCFGDLSSVKYFDQVMVNTIGSLNTDYSTGLFRVGGTLHVNPNNAIRGVGYPVYTLEADYIK